MKELLNKIKLNCLELIFNNVFFFELLSISPVIFVSLLIDKLQCIVYKSLKVKLIFDKIKTKYISIYIYLIIIK